MRKRRLRLVVALSLPSDRVEGDARRQKAEVWPKGRENPVDRQLLKS